MGPHKEVVRFDDLPFCLLLLVLLSPGRVGSPRRWSSLPSAFGGFKTLWSFPYFAIGFIIVVYQLNNIQSNRTS